MESITDFLEKLVCDLDSFTTHAHIIVTTAVVSLVAILTPVIAAISLASAFSALLTLGVSTFSFVFLFIPVLVSTILIASWLAAAFSKASASAAATIILIIAVVVGKAPARVGNLLERSCFIHLHG